MDGIEGTLSNYLTGLSNWLLRDGNTVRSFHSAQLQLDIGAAIQWLQGVTVRVNAATTTADVRRLRTLALQLAMLEGHV